MLKRILVLPLVIAFVLSSLGPLPPAHADVGLPAAGSIVNLSPAYEPVLIKGLTVHKNNPFLFDFIVDTGNSSIRSSDDLRLKQESDRLIKYFFACLTIPEKDLWVNLSPYEKNRMVPEALGQTALGRDLLAQDYILKQLTASMIDPEKNLGKEFWSRVYAKAQTMYGTSQIPVNTFNKVWILADKATVFEHGQSVFVVSGHLKVMLEEDYLALKKHENEGVIPAKAGIQYNAHYISSNIIRQIILPEIEHEVNNGQNFASLRQIFNSLILATWYKKNLKQAILTQMYADKNIVNGVIASGAQQSQEQIYEQYLKAYKKGVFNFIKEDMDSNGQPMPRKYFSGGFGANVQIGKDYNPADVRMRGTIFQEQVGAEIPSVKSAAMTVEEAKRRFRTFIEDYQKVLDILARPHITGRILEEVGIRLPNSRDLRDFVITLRGNYRRDLINQLKQAGLNSEDTKSILLELAKETLSADQGKLMVENKLIDVSVHLVFFDVNAEAVSNGSQEARTPSRGAEDPQLLERREVSNASPAQISNTRLLFSDNATFESDLEDFLKGTNSPIYGAPLGQALNVAGAKANAQFTVQSILGNNIQSALQNAKVVFQRSGALRDGKDIKALTKGRNNRYFWVSASRGGQSVGRFLVVDAAMETTAMTAVLPTLPELFQMDDSKLEAVFNGIDDLKALRHMMVGLQATALDDGSDSPVSKNMFSFLERRIQIVTWSELLSKGNQEKRQEAVQYLDASGRAHKALPETYVGKLRRALITLSLFIEDPSNDRFETALKSIDAAIELETQSRFLRLTGTLFRVFSAFLKNPSKSTRQGVIQELDKVIQFVKDFYPEGTPDGECGPAFIALKELLLSLALNSQVEQTPVNAAMTANVFSMGVNISNLRTLKGDDLNGRVMITNLGTQEIVQLKKEMPKRLWSNKAWYVFDSIAKKPIMLLVSTGMSKGITSNAFFWDLKKEAPESEFGELVKKTIVALQQDKETSSIAASYLRTGLITAFEQLPESRIKLDINTSPYMGIISKNKAMTTADLKQGLNRAPHKPDYGGIDLNTSNGMQWTVNKDGQGVTMNIDPAVLDRIKREGIQSLVPVIFRITRVNNILPLLGVPTPQ